MHSKVGTTAQWLGNVSSDLLTLVIDKKNKNYTSTYTALWHHYIFLTASEGYLKVIFKTITLSFFNEVTLSYTHSPHLQWLFFSWGCETQWKTHDHPSCLPLLALTEIIYTPAYWNYGERGWLRGSERGGIQFTPADLRKRSSKLEADKIDGDGRRCKSVCEDLSGMVHSTSLPCVCVCLRNRMTDRSREWEGRIQINIPQSNLYTAVN